MMRVGHLILLAMLALGTVARAQEEDDDPKSKPSVAAKPRAADKSDKKAEVKPKPEPKAEPKAEAQPKAKAEPVKKAPVEKAEKTEKAAENKTEVKVEKIADELPPVKKDKVKPLPKLARAPEAVEVMAPPEPGAAPRSVRVRLVDGSTVVGSVRAEQVDALVVDCSLGQLSIPRSRISTIAYDSAAGVGSKRAPVQQLDDDAPAPKKRGANP
jgi:hypothetical protein